MARAYGITAFGISYTTSIHFLLIMNGIGLIGRMAPAFLADAYTGPMNAIIPCGAVSGIVYFGWIAVHSEGGLYIWAVIYGLFAAGIQSLFPATLSSLTKNPQKMGVRMGMVFTIVSFACLTGTPISGALITAGKGSYLYTQIFSGGVILAGTALLTIGRLCGTGMVLKARI